MNTYVPRAVAEVYAAFNGMLYAANQYDYFPRREYINRWQAMNAGAMRTLGDLRDHESADAVMTATVRRLIIEYVKMAQATTGARYYFVQSNHPGTVGTLDEFLDSLFVTDESTARLRGEIWHGGNYLGLAGFFNEMPDFVEWSFEEGSVENYSGNHAASYRIDYDKVPEVRRTGIGPRVELYLGGVPGRASEVAAETSFRVARNGRLVSAVSEPGLRLLEPTSEARRLLDRVGDRERFVEQENLAYRQEILDRMRQWRAAEPDAEEVRKQEDARHQSYNRFTAFRDRFNERKVKEMLIPTLPFVEAGKGIKSSRRWGIEVETGAGRDLRGTPDQWDAKDDGSLVSAYTRSYIEPEDCDYASEHEEEITVRRVDNDEEFTIENPDYSDPDYCDYCGDVGSDDNYDDCVELVSPILNSMHSRGLRQICEDLESAPRTDSAGVHVHVEAKDLTVAQIKQLVLAYDHIEWLIESSYDRQERGYCRRRGTKELVDLVRQPDYDHYRDMRVGQRYVTLNLQALHSHGTVEFRGMGPRYNYDHLIRWAMFCREMVASVANGAKSKDFASVKDWNGLLAVFAKYGTEYNFVTVGQLEESTEFEVIEATV